MAKRKTIWDRHGKLKPSAMATVAERRFADAEALINTGSNAHANGAAYLAGFVIEILLKAQLVVRYSHLANRRQHEISTLSKPEQEVWSLIWRGHDLAAMLDRLPEVQAGLSARGDRSNVNYNADLRSVCSQWTVQARYSTRTMQMDEARRILEKVRSLKEHLK